MRTGNLIQRSAGALLMGWFRRESNREQLIDLVSQRLNVSRDRISNSKAIRKCPLDCDSLDIVELVMDLEDELGEGPPWGFA